MLPTARNNARRAPFAPATEPVRGGNERCRDSSQIPRNARTYEFADDRSCDSHSLRNHGLIEAEVIVHHAICGEVVFRLLKGEVRIGLAQLRIALKLFDL